MVNMQKQNQCETGRGSRQMPRHLLPSRFGQLALVLIESPSTNHPLQAGTAMHAASCSSVKTFGSAGHSLRKGQSASLCMCMYCHVPRSLRVQTVLCESIWAVKGAMERDSIPRGYLEQ